MAVSKKKLSVSGYILIAILIIVPVILAVLHFTGIIDLSFLGELIIGLYMWGSMSGWNALIISVAHIAVGMGIFYLLKAYFIGEKQVFMTTSQPAYQPTGQTINPTQQKDEETVVT